MLQRIPDVPEGIDAFTVVGTLTADDYELSGMLHHIRFARDHHRKVRRVALAVDSPAADLAPRLAVHFVRAELRHFDYDDLDDAVAWAAGPGGGRPAASPAEAPVPSGA